MPYVIRQNDKGEHCVYKETGGDSLGCHPTVEAAQKQIAAIHANEGKSIPMKAFIRGRKTGEIYLTAEAVRALCPSCADQMAKKSLKAVRLNDVTPSMLKNIKQQLGTGDPGFFGRCMSHDFGRSFGDKEAFCAWLHNRVEGEWPAEHQSVDPAAMPKKARTVKIFGLPNPFARPAKPDLSKIEQYVGLPSGVYNAIVSALSDIGAAIRNIDRLIQMAASDRDLDPAALGWLARHARNIEEATMYKKAERDAVALREILGQANQTMGRMGRVAAQIKQISAAKSSKAARKAYVERLVKDTIKMLQPEPIITKLVNAFDALERASVTLGEVVDDERMPEETRRRLGAQAMILNGLQQSIVGLRNKLRGLHLYDQTPTTAIVDKLWNKPDLR